MSKKWYESLNNRIDENKMFCKEIEVGTGLTEYSWSDRTPYEVVKVINQNNVLVRELDHKHIGNGQMDNNWELVSNENNPVKELKKLRGYWNWINTVTKESLSRLILLDDKTAKAQAKIEAGAKEAKINRRANISFGVAEYYYDYEF